MAGMRDLRISPRRVVPARLLSVRYSRSGGPGGQNVNKVATKVDLRLDLDGTEEVLGPTPTALIRKKLANRLDGQGNLHVVCSEHREQGRNLETAIERIEELLRGALVRPKARIPTRVSRASKERRLREKKRRSQIKRWRTGPE